MSGCFCTGACKYPPYKCPNSTAFERGYAMSVPLPPHTLTAAEVRQIIREELENALRNERSNPGTKETFTLSIPPDTPLVVHGPCPFCGVTVISGKQCASEEESRHRKCLEGWKG
jgi:hypothetical protein